VNNCTASNDNAVAIGSNNTASGNSAFAAGFINTASGALSGTLGNGNTTSGTGSMAFGIQLRARSNAEVVLGLNNTDYSPLSASAFNGADRLLVVGNGSSSGSRSDALVVLKNGNTGIGSSTPTAKLEVAGQVKITGGSPGANKILMSDANGLATWQVTYRRGIGIVSNQTMRHNGTNWVANSAIQ
jgi:hypothetical protein